MDIKKFGRYDVVRVLGTGAMGVVYEGRDPYLDRPVAIKTIRVQNLSKADAQEYERRFRTEARSAARLQHPNIVSVFDSGQDDGIAYLVMEFIHGDDLKHHLERGTRFAMRPALVMIHELLTALDHAHQQNVVHRDVKPANVLIEASGRIKLADFGVARIQEPDEAAMTQVGAGALGTPKYMSPEQAKGQSVDARSDLFSTGVVLYELLTGSKPFDGENSFVVIHQIVSHDPVPPSSLNPEVSAAMDEVVANALAKNPEDRFATAHEFDLALRMAAQAVSATAATSTGVATEISQRAGHPAGSDAGDLALHDGIGSAGSGGGSVGAQGTVVGLQAELAYWKDIKDSVDPQDFLDFLEKFPSGVYAQRVQRRLKTLTDGQQTQPASDPVLLPLNVPATIAATSPGSATRRKKWLVPALGGLASAVVAIVFYFGSNPGSTGSKEDAINPVPVAASVAIAPDAAGSAPTAAAAAASALPADAAASAAAAVASAPWPAAQPASAAASVPPRPLRAKASAASTGVSTRTPDASGTGAQKPRAAQPLVDSEVILPAPPKVQQEGPSMPGQACADKVFVARVACVARQCQTDHYRQTGECVQFRAMEKMREEQRNDQ